MQSFITVHVTTLPTLDPPFQLSHVSNHLAKVAWSVIDAVAGPPDILASATVEVSDTNGSVCVASASPFVL